MIPYIRLGKIVLSISVYYIKRTNHLTYGCKNFRLWLLVELRKLQNSEETRIEVEQKRDTLKSQLLAVEKDRERLLKIHESDKKQVIQLDRNWPHFCPAKYEVVDRAGAHLDSTLLLTSNINYYIKYVHNEIRDCMNSVSIIIKKTSLCNIIFTFLHCFYKNKKKLF